MKSMLFFVLFAAACGPTGEDTGTTCPDPDPLTLTWDTFGHSFMTTYCTWCHDSSLTRSRRNGAPLYHDFETLEGVLRVPEHIDQQAGSGPDATNELMPPDRCPSVAGGKLDVDCMKPTLAERKQLAEWIACEKKRPHEFFDAGVDAP